MSWGSAPRRTGAHMAIHENGTMVGSVSGGCVEGDVVRHAQECLQSGENKVLDYHVTDEQAWDVGLTCGGRVRILLEPFFAGASPDASHNFWRNVSDAVEEERGIVIAHHVSMPGGAPSVVAFDDDSELGGLAYETYAHRRHLLTEVDGREILLEIVPPNSRLIIIGAAHVTVDLVHFARQLNFQTIVIDPRGVFAEQTSFRTSPDRLINAWPETALRDIPLDPFTYAVTLSHQPRIDDQALQILLRSEVAYIGALGSRKSHAKRTARLSEAGFEDQEIARIHAPVGVDIHAASAREIALSIIAEIIKVKNQYV
ncbi:MAG: XdhC family protein [Saprospiraceae bacterium]|nr:XdhC family protein [Saprospiraceae bacterium]